MHTFIDDAATLSAWLAERPARAPIGLDTEFMRTNTFYPRLALVQINLGGDIALLDSPQLGDHGTLGARLRDAAVPCIMHSASEDLEAMAPFLPDGPAVLFDTQIAAAMAGIGYGMSYQKLVLTLLDVDLPKSETRSDWLQRPLSASQLDYAAQDVAYLPELHVRLSERLESLGRSAWLAEDCQRMVERLRHPAPDTQPHAGYRSASAWPQANQALLRRLLLWRDASARQLDKPRSWLLDDAHALDLAERPPADENELFDRTKGLRALRGAQRADVFALLHAPLGDEDKTIAPIPPPLTTAQKRAIAAMKERVADVANSLDLPEGLLCARRHLEALVADRAWPSTLEGWRRPLLHDALVALLP